MIGPSHRLVQSARARALHHALLLHGPSPKLLRKVAIDIAKALNCRNNSEGDGCPSCQKIDRDIHPDVHVLEPAKDRKAISIEQIRELVGGASMRPYEGGVKVFIIDPADALSGAAANSLLKTLEEPSRDTAFMLITRSADLLLPTIKSRCQIVYIRAEDDAPGADTHDDVAAEISERIGEFAKSRDMAALLGIAPIVCSVDDAKEGLACLARVLRDLATSSSPAATSLGQHALLSAAHRALEGVSALNVNADARLLVEGALVELARRGN